MTTYTLIKDQEQLKLDRIRNRHKCYASHLWVTKDSGSHIWPFLQCNGCDQMPKCREYRQGEERELNG